MRFTHFLEHYLFYWKNLLLQWWERRTYTLFGTLSKKENKKGSHFRNYLIQRAENGTQTLNIIHLYRSIWELLIRYLHPLLYQCLINNNFAYKSPTLHFSYHNGKTWNCLVLNFHILNKFVYVLISCFLKSMTHLCFLRKFMPNIPAILFLEVQ